MKTQFRIGLLSALLIGGAGFVYAQDDNAETTEAEVVEAQEEATQTDAAQSAEADASTDSVSAPVVASDADLSVVVATVDGDPITLGDVLVVKADTPDQFLQGSDEEVMQNIVQQIALQRVLSSQAKESAVLELRIDNVVHSARAQEALQDYVDANLTDERIQETYDEVIGNQPDQTEWDASHILVETQDEAVAIKARLDDGEEFATVAEEASNDPGSAARGGNLGWFGPGQMVPQFEQAVTELEPGQISEPIQTDFGWHVILLNETRVAEKPKFEDIEPQLRDYAQSELVNNYIETLEAETDIEPAADVDASMIEMVLPE